MGQIVDPTDLLRPYRCELNIYFDCDYTILAMDGSLRPRTREVFSNLIEDEHKVFIWSGVGLRTKDMERLNLMDLISGFLSIRYSSEYPEAFFNCKAVEVKSTGAFSLNSQFIDFS